MRVGGSKVFAEKAPSSGRHICVTATPGRMVTHPTANFLGRRFESWWVDAGGGGAAAVLAAQGFEPHYHSATANCNQLFSPLLGPMSATDKKPKVCVSV